MIKNHIRTITVIVAVLLILASIFSYIYKFINVIDKLELYKNNSYNVTCTIDEFPFEKDNRIRIYGHIKNSDHPANITGYKVLFDIPKDNYDILKYGNTIRFTAKIEPAHSGSNYGNFNYRDYLMSKNTVAISELDNNTHVELISQNKGISMALYNMQKTTIFNTEKYFSGDNGALIKAMLTGDREDIDDDLRESYQKSGIYHIVSVSGLHTGIFVSVFTYFLAFLPFGTRRKSLISKITAIILSTLLLMFTGYGVSVTRVILMSAVTAVCFMSHREYNIIVSILIAAFIIVLFAPYNIFNQSFQLSFVSTLGLCIALKLREKYKMSNRFEYIKSSLAISAGSSAATAPISAYCFGTVSIAGFIANIIIIPLATVLLISIIVFCTLSALLPSPVMYILAYIPNMLAEVINTIAEIVSKFKYSSIETNLADVFSAFILSGIIFMTINLIIRKKYFNSALLLLIVLFMAFSSADLTTNKMRVTFINCVKGESTIITTPSNKTIMFDCGSSSFSDPSEDLFETYFNHNEITKIDTLYVSYFDIDHINGINKLIVKGYIKSLVIPPETDVKNENIRLNRAKVINTANRYNVPITTISSGDVHTIGNGIFVSVIGDNFDLKDKNSCVVYKITYNNTSFLLSSCIGAVGQKQLTGVTECTVMKLPNYGNVVNATENYILQSKSKYCVITAPTNDKYLSVSDELIKILGENNIKTFRTDYNQTITFITDGNTITKINLRKGETN